MKVNMPELQEDIPSEKPSRCWPLGGYAPGNYTCKCMTCGKLHEADKRASQCLVCAVMGAQEEIERARWDAYTDAIEIALSFVHYQRSAAGIAYNPMVDANKIAHAIRLKSVRSRYPSSKSNPNTPERDDK